MRDIECLRAELTKLIQHAGGDNEARNLALQYCGGYAADRSTFGKLRRGEGSESLLSSIVTILRVAIENKIRIDTVGEGVMLSNADSEQNNAGTHQGHNSVIKLKLNIIFSTDEVGGVEVEFESGIGFRPDTAASDCWKLPSSHAISFL